MSFQNACFSRWLPKVFGAAVLPVLALTAPDIVLPPVFAHGCETITSIVVSDPALPKGSSKANAEQIAVYRTTIQNQIQRCWKVPTDKEWRCVASFSIDAAGTPADIKVHCWRVNRNCSLVDESLLSDRKIPDSVRAAIMAAAPFAAPPPGSPRPIDLRFVLVCNTPYILSASAVPSKKPGSVYIKNAEDIGLPRDVYDSYRNGVVAALRSVWPTDAQLRKGFLRLSISRSGGIFRAQIFDDRYNPVDDKEILYKIRKAELPPLPNGLKSAPEFEIDLSLLIAATGSAPVGDNSRDSDFVTIIKTAAHDDTGLHIKLWRSGKIRYYCSSEKLKWNDPPPQESDFQVSPVMANKLFLDLSRINLASIPLHPSPKDNLGTRWFNDLAFFIVFKGESSPDFANFYFDVKLEPVLKDAMSVAALIPGAPDFRDCVCKVERSSDIAPSTYCNTSANYPPARVSTPGNVGNIGPYRKLLNARIVKDWHSPGGPLIALTIGKTGQIKGMKVIESGVSKDIDRLALSKIAAMSFAPLPDWYKGDELTFSIHLARLVP